MCNHHSVKREWINGYLDVELDFCQVRYVDVTPCAREVRHSGSMAQGPQLNHSCDTSELESTVQQEPLSSLLSS